MLVVATDSGHTPKNQLNGSNSNTLTKGYDDGLVGEHTHRDDGNLDNRGKKIEIRANEEVPD